MLTVGVATIHHNKEVVKRMFKLKEGTRTRLHEVNVKEWCRLDIRKYLFSQKTINEWNKLSTDCVNAGSVNMFKSILTYIS